MSGNNRQHSFINLIRVILFLFIAISFLSCTDRSVTDKLDMAEAVMQDYPDSSLDIIRSIDTLSVQNKAVWARYSLLKAIALDKNYIDTTDVSVIKPAVDYYVRRGTPDEKLKSYYYLGRIQENSRNFNDAAVSYSLGEGYASVSEDEQMKGLLYMAFANIYNKTRNKEQEEYYVAKGISSFEMAGDVKHCNLSKGRLAILYYGRQEWNKADSLFRSGIEQAREDTIAMSVFLSNYARLKVVQPSPDPAGAIELLQKLSLSYKRQLSLTDYGVWAYAAALSGDESTCTQIVNQLERLKEAQRGSILYWLYRIEYHRGNYEKALAYNIESNAVNSKFIDGLLSDSIGQSLHNYYSSMAGNLKNESHILRLRLILVVLGLSLILLVSLGCLKYNKDRHEQEIDRLIRIGEESNNLLIQAKEDLQDEIKYLEDSRGELEMTLERLRKSFVSTYKDKFSAVGQLCSVYMDSNKRSDKKEFIVRRVESIIACISDDNTLHMHFENQINKDLNNIVKRLKADLGDVSKMDSRFICYCIVGFDPELISSVLGLSISNVYTKKSRLKERIRGLDTPYKEEYLRML